MPYPKSVMHERKTCQICHSGIPKNWQINQTSIRCDKISAPWNHHKSRSLTSKHRSVCRTERIQRRWCRRIYKLPVAAKRPIQKSTLWPWSSMSPRSSHQRWKHRRNNPNVITIGPKQRRDAASQFNRILLLSCVFHFALAFFIQFAFWKSSFIITPSFLYK